MTASPLGIIAGKGLLPLKIITACKEQKRPFVVIAFRGQTDPTLVEGISHLWVTLGAIAEPLAYLKEVGATELVFAGALTRPSLRHIKFDKMAAQWIAKIGRKAFGDDGLLSGILERFEEEGFQIVSVQSILHNLQVASGVFGRHSPSKRDEGDIERGIAVLQALGPLDVGQALVVEDGVILSIEGAEGTDAMINRTKALQKTPEGGVLIKIAKPQQSHRVDLPTIGPETARKASQAGFRGIVIEANATLVLEKQAVIEICNQAGMFFLGVDPGKK